MIRHLIPRFQLFGWCGAALSRDPDDGEYQEAQGVMLCVQWLGVMVEFGMGRVR